MTRILHLADLHLGWEPRFPGERAAQRRAERDRLLERAVDHALQPGSDIHLVIIAGDLFESHRPEAALVEGVLRQLRRLTEAGIPVVTVPGNHDEITYHDSVYRTRAADWPGILVQNPMPAHAATVTAGGTPCHIYSLAYTGGLTRTSPPLTDFPRLDEAGLHIGVFHGSLDWDAGERSLYLSSSALARAGYDYIALGHIHQHQVHTVGRTKAVYPGAVGGKDFSDPGVGFFTVATVGNGKMGIEQVPAGVRPILDRELDAGGFDSLEELREAVGALGDGKAVVRVRLTGLPAFPVAVDALEAALRDRFHFLEVVDETASLTLDALEGLAAEATIRGEFVRRLRTRIEEAGDDEERRVAERALRLGLASLTGDGHL